jgi:hypothetical protein
MFDVSQSLSGGYLCVAAAYASAQHGRQVLKSRLSGNWLVAAESRFHHLE